MINITNHTIMHAKSVIQSLQTDNTLPFADVFSTQAIADKISELDYRDRIYTPDVTIFGFLSQAISADQSQQAAVTKIIAHLASQGREVPSANTSAYSQARSRLPLELLSNSAKEVATALEKQVPAEWLWRGREIKIPDGTTLSMPDTHANQETYPQPDSQKEGIGFPIMRLVGIFSLATGALLDSAMGPYAGKRTGEHALLRQLMHNFKSGDIVLGDAYYGSYWLLAALIQIGADAVFPQQPARKTDFRKGKRLGKKDHLAQWKKPCKPEWMTEQEYADLPATITIRETKIIYSGGAGFSNKSMTVITTLLDNKDVTQKDLSDVYSYRWFVELDLRSIKEVMHMDILRSKTPEMVRKEIWAHFLAYNLVRQIMAQSACINKIKPREISFKLALQMMDAYRQVGILCDDANEIYFSFLRSIAYKKVGNRPGRSEPRMVKRRPKSFPRLQKSRNLYKNKAA